MTREEINEYLTVELFGECWHDWRESLRTDDDYWCCEKCGRLHSRYYPLADTPDYFTWEGAGKVIEAMRAKKLAWWRIGGSDDAAAGVSFCSFSAVVGHAVSDNLPEAVARAAVEFLKTEVK